MQQIASVCMRIIPMSTVRFRTLSGYLRPQGNFEANYQTNRQCLYLSNGKDRSPIAQRKIHFACVRQGKMTILF